MEDGKDLVKKLTVKWRPSVWGKNWPLESILRSQVAKEVILLRTFRLKFEEYKEVYIRN